MTPETATLVGGIATAVISAGPAYLAFRQARGARKQAQAAESAVEHEGTQTRDALTHEIQILLARIEGRIDGVNSNINDLRTWQVGHTAEHITIRAEHGDR